MCASTLKLADPSRHCCADSCTATSAAAGRLLHICSVLMHAHRCLHRSLRLPLPLAAAVHLLCRVRMQPSSSHLLSLCGLDIIDIVRINVARCSTAVCSLIAGRRAVCLFLSASMRHLQQADASPASEWSHILAGDSRVRALAALRLLIFIPCCVAAAMSQRCC